MDRSGPFGWEKDSSCDGRMRFLGGSCGSSSAVPYAESLWPLAPLKLRSEAMLCWLLVLNESWLAIGTCDGRPWDLRPWDELAGRGAGEFRRATLFMAA